MKYLTILGILVLALSSCSKPKEYQCSIYKRISQGDYEVIQTWDIEFDNEEDRIDYQKDRNANMPNGSVVICALK